MHTFSGSSISRCCCWFWRNRHAYAHKQQIKQPLRVSWRHEYAQNHRIQCGHSNTCRTWFTATVDTPLHSLHHCTPLPLQFIRVIIHSVCMYLMFFFCWHSCHYISPDWIIISISIRKHLIISQEFALKTTTNQTNCTLKATTKMIILSDNFISRCETKKKKICICIYAWSIHATYTFNVAFFFALFDEWSKKVKFNWAMKSPSYKRHGRIMLIRISHVLFIIIENVIYTARKIERKKATRAEFSTITR